MQVMNGGWIGGTRDIIDSLESKLALSHFELDGLGLGLGTRAVST